MKLKLLIALLGMHVLAKLRSAALGKYTSAIMVSTDGMDFLVPRDDFLVARRLVRHGVYDSENLAIYREHINSESRVLIVGAHVGAILVPLAREVKSIVGVEANPRMFELLKRNVLLNRLSNCELFNVAAFDQPGNVEFLDSKTNSGGGKILPKEALTEFYYDRPALVSVRAGRLDDILTGGFDLIIMDIEGAEYRALLGMQRILTCSKVLVCELLPNHLINAAGVDFPRFLSSIPEAFQHFSLTTNPRIIVPRSDANALYEQVRKQNFYGGADLICTV